jgi:hypothetical protein
MSDVREQHECEECGAVVDYELIDVGWTLVCETCAECIEAGPGPGVDAREDFHSDG